MIYTNENNHGGNLFGAIKAHFADCKNAIIASGYSSDDIVEEFEDDFCRVSQTGFAKLLLGMAFYEGLAQKNLDRLTHLNVKLSGINSNSGIYVSHSRRFHGKIYYFDYDNAESQVLVGSSNFSRSGLTQNLECNALVSEPNAKSQAREYLNFLFDSANSAIITNTEITVFGSREYNNKVALDDLNQLSKYAVTGLSTQNLPHFDYPLMRTATAERSNLNAYFGKGRLSSSTGKIIPRPWYEVELIAPIEITNNPLYPHGDFTGYTDDGYVLPMKTSGDYHKNIRSRGGLQLLGQWIKGKLQRKNALLPLTPVDAETFNKYGKDYIRFYKIKNNEYFMEF